MPYDDLKIKTKDNIYLHGWFIKQNDSTLRPTIIYFHENAGSKKFFIKFIFFNFFQNIFICQILDFVCL